MARQALHKREDTDRIERKLKEGGQLLPKIIPLGPPLANDEAMLERLGEALADSDPRERSEILDRLYHAALGQVTNGFSPAAMTLAYIDWLMHLANSPHRQMELTEDAQRRWANLCLDCLSYLWGEEGACCPQDERFQMRYKEEGWQRWPYNVLARAYLDAEEWWCKASCIQGMTKHHQRVVTFLHRLALSALSPENHPITNPQMQGKLWKEHGMNYVKGFSNALEDMRRWWMHEPPAGSEQFQPGETVALTEGKVIFRNALFELIQYAPKTKQVYPEPLLVIPAWIMKYYILDLSPQNSMVKYLVEQGHTVFMISWKNPDARYRDVGFTDYLKEGALQALDVVREVIPDRQVHAVGYCIGGTLLAMLAAYIANKSETPLKTVTLFAAQTDFSEAGQLMTFIDASQLSYLQDIMFSQGYLRGDQISATFDLLKPRELIWHRIAHEYLLGERDKPFDLMAWDSDTTRLPYRMHTEYLHALYLNNKLAKGEFEVDGEPLDLDLIRLPVFVVSTEKDHIAPWRSVYKLHHLTDTEITFVLASKGHNGGIVSEPGHKGRSFRIGKREAEGRFVHPDKWMKTHELRDGSWWPAWHDWLAEHSGEKVAPPPMGGKNHRPLIDAPGEYVHER